MNTTPASLASQLHEEHLRTLSVINELEDRVIGQRNRPLDMTDPGDRDRLQRFIDMVDRDLLRHYRFEEEMLFPRITEAGLGSITEMLMHEHDAVRTIVEPMRQLAAAALANGFDAASWGAFREGMMDLVHSVTFHIQKEEMSVVQRLESVLEDQASNELAAVYPGFR